MWIIRSTTNLDEEAGGSLMFTIVAATMLSMAAAKADPVDAARKTFRNCMIELHNEQIKAKTAPADFTKVAETGCTDTRTSYHDIVVKSERGYGSSAKDAEEYANEQIQEIVDGIVENFSENSEKNATMFPEP